MCLFGLMEKLFGYNFFSIIENVADYEKNGTQPSYRNGVDVLNCLLEIQLVQRCT